MKKSVGSTKKGKGPARSPKPHQFGRPRLNQNKLAFRHGRPPTAGVGFHDLPAPTGKPPYHLDLSQIIPADQYKDVTNAKRLVFHTAGDMGGINFAIPQERVAQGLEEDFVAGPADRSLNPGFFYAL